MSATILHQCPQGTTPLNDISFNAANVPVANYTKYRKHIRISTGNSIATCRDPHNSAHYWFEEERPGELRPWSRMAAHLKVAHALPKQITLSRVVLVLAKLGILV
ncbi:MAG: hypothetical protein JO189_19305 [Deltaproteobacteria bacterium]|nr:hypothetical protein [Deltaproteobacteria bacterium]